MLGIFFMKRHTKNFGLLPFALLPSVFSLCPVTSLRHFLVFHPSNLYSLLSLFPLSLCAFVFSYICLFQASLVLFTSTTLSVLGSRVALGHAISHRIKFPITLPILRPWEQLDGPIQWPSSSGQFAWSTTNRAARTEPAPPRTSPPSPPSPCVSPRGLWAGGGGLGIPQVLLDLSSLPLPSRFWNPSGLLAATQPTWQERSEFD